jgi:hypothetical protein
MARTVQSTPLHLSGASQASCDGTDSPVRSVTLPWTVLPVPSHPHGPKPTSARARARARARTRHGPPPLRIPGGPCAPRSIALCPLLSSSSLFSFPSGLSRNTLITSSSRSRACTCFRSLPSDPHLFQLRERARWTRPLPPPPSSTCLPCPSRPVPLQHSPLYLSLTETSARWFPRALETPPQSPRATEPIPPPPPTRPKPSSVTLSPNRTSSWTSSHASRMQSPSPPGTGQQTRAPCPARKGRTYDLRTGSLARTARSSNPSWPSVG